MSHPTERVPPIASRSRNSIYVADGFTKQGVGSALLAELIEQCERSRRFRQVIAVIGDSGNTASIELHRKFGFSHAGTLRDVGFKLRTLG